MEFQALVDGRLVAYPRHATFVIERRRKNGPFGLLAEKPCISSAVAKFHRAAQPGTITRLSSVFDGRVRVMLKEAHA